MNRFLLISAIVMLFGFARMSYADLVYTSGPISGEIQAYDISDPGILSNEFTVSNPAALTSAVIGLWSKDTPTAIDWSIGTTAYGSQISSGSGASLTNTVIGMTTDGYTVYSSTFSLNSPTLADGIYWFTLHGATMGTEYWDENSSVNQPIFDNSTGTESFSLFGSSVPEPSRVVGLFGIANIGLIGLVWRRRRLAS